MDAANTVVAQHSKIKGIKQSNNEMVMHQTNGPAKLIQGVCQFNDKDQHNVQNK